MDHNKVTLTISISKECHKKLKEQLTNLLSANAFGFFDIGGCSLESLIEKYLEQMSSVEEQYKFVQNKMEHILTALTDKGVDMMDLFNALNEKEEKEKERKSKAKKN